MPAPLEGMKILDFTYLLPGPFATMMLADLGAEIIKIENSEAPDMLRLAPPYVDNNGAAYLQVNRGKRSLSLNLKKEEAREIVYRLVKNYDVVVEQFRPGVMDRLGIGYDALKAINPSLIFCSLTGYGQTGSYANRAGHDINYLALSGLESFSGRKDTGPCLSGIQIADIAAGSKNLVIGVLAAYACRQRTGRGDRIDVSITDGVFAMCAYSVAGYLAGGPEPKREGDILNGGTMYDYYRTADGEYLAVGAMEPKFFAAFCEAIGCPEIIPTGIMNWNHKDRVAAIIASKPLAHWQNVFAEIEACVEPVRSVSEAVSSPPLAERGMIIEIPTSSGTCLRQIGNPIKFESGHYHAAEAGCPIGFHNEEILTELGYNSYEIARLIESGAVGKSLPSE